jgi:hypothetical protein
MIWVSRAGRGARIAVLLAALLAMWRVTPSPNLSRARVVITDTTMSLSPSSGSSSTSFTATLTYTPKGAVCPQTATTVSFTWDGYNLGTSTMQGSTSPCHATLRTKPRTGNTDAGAHQVCGTFQQGAHKGCAPFQVAASTHSPSPSSASSPKSQGGASPTATPRPASSLKPGASQTPESSPRSSTQAAAPAPRNVERTGGGSLGAMVVGGLVLLIALWFAVRKGLLRSR